jgi:signal transduction histidine kinase
MGLIGMRERAWALGGDVRWTHAEVSGTAVEAWLPLPPGVRQESA